MVLQAMSVVNEGKGTNDNVPNLIDPGNKECGPQVNCDLLYIGWKYLQEVLRSLARCLHVQSSMSLEVRQAESMQQFNNNLSINYAVCITK